MYQLNIQNEQGTLLCSDTDKSEKGQVQTNNGQCDNLVSCEQVFKEIGAFGLYQILVGIASGLALIISALATFNFVFAAAIPDHRCWVPECEGIAIAPKDFTTEWTKYAVPNKGDQLDNCHRYQYIAQKDVRNDLIIGSCSAEGFNQSEIVKCDRFVMRDNEQRLISWLNMACTGQEDKLAIIGTANTLGRLVGMPVAGIISDKFGRLNTIIVCSVLSSIFSCFQTLPASLMSYEFYLLLELLGSFASAGVLGATYVFNTEWTTVKYRVYLNSIASYMNGLHVLVIGVAAWYYENNFLAYKLVLAVPGLFMVLFYFILRESPQWLLTRHKYTQAIDSISNAGRINRRTPHEKTIEQIHSESLHNDFMKANGINNEKTITNSGSDQVTMINILGRKVLLFRLFILSLVWFFAVYAYYGIVLGSQHVHENKYISYVLIGLAEIPGTLFAKLILDRIGRRKTIALTLLLCGAMLLLSTQMSTHQQIHQLVMYFIGRSAIKASLLGLSTYTTELWPTAVRNTIFSICGLCGRLGGIFASLAVLIKYYENLPAILSGSVTIAGSIVLFVFLPETLNCDKLPDTIEDSLAIGISAKNAENSPNLNTKTENYG